MTAKAEVSVDGNLTPGSEVSNRLSQGCVIVPSLFNLYFNLVISQWRKKCADLVKCGGKLDGERTRKPDKLKLSVFLFADDAAAAAARVAWRLLPPYWRG